MPPAHLRLRRVVQTIADIEQKPWAQLRILDLGSLEGLFALEFASHGAQVVAIEGRETNNSIARAAAKSRNFSNIEFITSDVRELNVARHGQFDVVLCSGILYHLPAKDACEFIQSIAEVCKHLTIIDTHVALLDKWPTRSFKWRDRTYYGTTYKEHSPEDDDATKLSRSWASLDNVTSFWMSKPSLLNLLRDVGFTSVSEVLRPQSFLEFEDRLTFAAIKGEAQHFSISPELESTPEADWAEVSDLKPYPLGPSEPSKPPHVPLWKRVGRAVKRRIIRK
jgi:SAM-dependent methyltransferase